MTPIKSIRAKCLDCCCGQMKEVSHCPITDCPLYPYRMGKRPKQNSEVDGTLTEEDSEGEEISIDDDAE